MESTYGSREHGCTQAEARDKLAAAVRRAVEHAHPRLRHRPHPDPPLPPQPPGRSRRSAIPVAVDTPMGIRVTELHAEPTGLFDAEALDRMPHGDDPLDFEALYAVRRGRDSHRLRELPGPMVIIAGSGMCTGRIVRYLLDRLPLPGTTVLLVGYQAPGTSGRSLQCASRATGLSSTARTARCST